VTFAAGLGRAGRASGRKPRGGGCTATLALIRPAWVRSERFRPALLASAGDPQDTHRDLDEQLLEACIAHRPDEAAKAFYDHLELASLFFQTELGGRGIFER